MCEYTLEEVGTHCTKRSCWVVVHNEVYDVTDFMNEVRELTLLPQQYYLWCALYSILVEEKYSLSMLVMSNDGVFG